ncbi:alkaline phosphatase [Staphylococcus agnetis]|uniref:alkaline phosphatase n=1 Tax=Staphylococcus agnetis TaxID=985762 RepID=UPI000CD15255|nr:alkaline phosphatase [Staphylococcus agnetis]MBY7664407.1 alkaline phosphatase [Staphylococcus agnetis]NJH68766.1 alkaline phosphatase [Staphylococcus agnetis]NJH79200.1 alkaline phosphatase [Staphylococcus agnetis]PNY84631.1 alkaline phosphatase [Staphylococcus agnetis]PTH65881.1 alkaline phosphatase [Staphylococcus agnetis]
MKIVGKLTKVSLASSLIASSILGVSQATYAKAQSKQNQAQDKVAMYGNTKNPKNVIFMVGDGMGPSYNSAYRYFKDNPNTKEMEKTAFDHYLVGTQRTNPDDPKENITDSAAGATAFSSGHKTYNGAIGVTPDKKPVETVLERAKSQGKSTGLVSTAEITDATPAAYAAHIDSRDKKDEIAKQFYNDRINGKHKVDVLLGGGAKYFGKENGDIDKKFKKDGYDLVKNKQQLAHSKKDQVLGLFADKNMPLQIDAPKQNPLLSDMQDAALSKLSKNKKGFFLMVEGASIDKQGHANDITGVMSEMSGFESAFENAMKYAQKHPDTLVVATADHSTGGLTIGKGKDYKWDPKAIQSMKHSGKWMAEEIASGKDVTKTIQAGYGFDVSKSQIDVIQKEADAIKGLDEKKDKAKYEAQLQKLQDAIQKPINDQSHTGWTTYGHTGEDVNTYAYGPGSNQWQGNIDNTENATHIFDFFGNNVKN